jgi:hypothetical protein
MLGYYLYLEQIGMILTNAMQHQQEDGIVAQAWYGTSFVTSRARRDRFFNFFTKILPKYGIYCVEPTADMKPSPISFGSIHKSNPNLTPGQVFLYLNQTTTDKGGTDVTNNVPYPSWFGFRTINESKNADDGCPKSEFIKFTSKCFQQTMTFCYRFVSRD